MDTMWKCPSCGHFFLFDYGDGVCPHCADPLSREFALTEPPELPFGWIQWKGTNVCMDVHCLCGAMVHIDMDFAYYLQCGHCQRVYMNPGYTQLKELTGEAREKALESPSLHVLEDDEEPGSDDES